MRVQSEGMKDTSRVTQSDLRKGNNRANIYNRTMRRNTVRSLSHVRDFVASAFFAEKKGRVVRRETEERSLYLYHSVYLSVCLSIYLPLSFSFSLSFSLPQNARSVQNIIYLSSLIGRRSL